jgi:hypothetical protein
VVGTKGMQLRLDLGASTGQCWLPEWAASRRAANSVSDVRPDSGGGPRTADCGLTDPPDSLLAVSSLQLGGHESSGSASTKALIDTLRWR